MSDDLSPPISPHPPTNNMLKIFQALSHPVRLSICLLLMRRDYCVGDLCRELELKQYAVSQQLASLRAAHIVHAERQARQVIYRLSDEQVKRIIRISMSRLNGLASAGTTSTAPPVSRQKADGFARIIPASREK